MCCGFHGFRSLKTVAPMVLGLAVPFVGPAIGAALGATTLAGETALGGAVLGGLGGAISGRGLKGVAEGAALGGVGGYVSGAGGVGNALSGTGGAAAGAGSLNGMTAAQMAGQASADAASGFAGGIGPSVISYAPSAASSSGNILGEVGNIAGTASKLAPYANIAGGLMQGDAGAEAARKAAEEQAAAMAPYQQAGAEALQQYRQLSGSPEAQANFIKTNPLYQSLADDAQRRLMAQRASQGMLGTGGTQVALQNQLMTLGTGLVNNQLNNLMPTVSSGQSAAGDVGNAQAAGTIGGFNAQNSAYQNTINTLLALQRLKSAQSGMI